MALNSEDYGGDVSEFLSGNYFKKEDFDEDDSSMALVIAGVERVQFKDKNGLPDTKIQLGFKGQTKKLTLNQTNLKLLIKHYGKKASEWINRPVLLYLDENVMFAGNAVGGLRLRVPKAARQVPAPDPEPAVADETAIPF